MSLDLNLTLADSALQPFRAAYDAAVLAAEQATAADLIHSARSHQQTVQALPMAGGIREKIARIDDAIAFLEDRSWVADGESRRAIVGALQYFVDAVDLIPDSHPQFGLLDDAIVLELALHAAGREWEAWHEFTDFKRSYPQHADIDRSAWLQLRREELDLALRHRRRHNAQSGRSYSARAPLTAFVVN